MLGLARRPAGRWLQDHQWSEEQRLGTADLYA